jgi:hypothetical protein
MWWLLVAAMPLAMILLLWWYGWLRRDRKPPSPTKPYREWD